jgi:hypothetical protein
MLASLGVLLGVMLAVSPGEALAVALAEPADDVLTVGIESHAIDEVTFNQTFIFALNPGEAATPNFIFQLVETNPDGSPLLDANHLFIISDTLSVTSDFNTQTGLFSQIFTFISDPNGVGLPNLCAVQGNVCVPERAGPIVVGNFGSLGQVSVRSDVVPEPSTWLLLLLGLGVAGLAAWQRKRESDLQ